MQIHGKPTITRDCLGSLLSATKDSLQECFGDEQYLPYVQVRVLYVGREPLRRLYELNTDILKGHLARVYNEAGKPFEEARRQAQLDDSAITGGILARAQPLYALDGQGVTQIEQASKLEFQPTTPAAVQRAKLATIFKVSPGQLSLDTLGTAFKNFVTNNRLA